MQTYTFIRDEEFDGLRGDAFSVTGVPDTNLPTNGSRYVDPIQQEIPIGWFGKHYSYRSHKRYKCK